MKDTVQVLAVLLLLAGCATQPQFVTEPGVSLSSYKALAVAPVSNETGQALSFDFMTDFAEDLKSALRSKGYDVSDSNAAPSDVLIVQCSIVNYVPGNALEQFLSIAAPLASMGSVWVNTWGATQAGVKTFLVDKKTGQALAHLVTVKQVEFRGNRSALQSVANDIATAIDIKI